MEREEIIEKLNKSFQNNTLNVNEYLPLLSEFLVTEHSDKADKLIPFIMNQPMLIGQTIQKTVDYFIRKFNIFRLSKNINGQNINILFY